MEGYGPDKGVSPRAVAELFNIVESSKNEWSYALTFSMLEIYNESILDLLDKSPIKVAHSAVLRPALSCYANPCPVLSYLTLIRSFMSWFIVYCQTDCNSTFISCTSCSYTSFLSTPSYSQ
jgi:Kinesin motor domain